MYIVHVALYIVQCTQYISPGTLYTVQYKNMTHAPFNAMLRSVAEFASLITILQSINKSSHRLNHAESAASTPSVSTDSNLALNNKSNLGISFPLK